MLIPYIIPGPRYILTRLTSSEILAKKDVALPIYERFKKFLSKKLDKEISEGIFGANMQVESVNDGPVTIILDSKNKY